MKLKKVLSGLMAAVIAVTSSVVMTATVDAADGATEIVGTGLEHLSISQTKDNEGNPNGWSNQAQISGCYELSNYKTATLNLDIGTIDTDVSDIAMEVFTSGWGYLTGAYADLSNTELQTLSIDLSSLADPAILTFRVSTNVIDTGESISNSTFDELSIEFTYADGVSAPATPELPAYKYAFGYVSDTVGNSWSQPAYSDIGADKAITNDVFADNDYVVVAHYSTSAPACLALSDNSGNGALNWIQVSPTVKLNGVAYFTKSDIVTAWTNATGLSDLSDLMKIYIQAGGSSMKISEAYVYSSLSNAKSITISNTIENGEVKASAETAVAGTEITLTATPAEGYELDAYTVKDASDNTVTVTDGKFTMPASAVTVSATFKKVPTNPVEVAYDAIVAYLETVTFDNDFHATNQAKAIEALVKEKASDARVNPNFNVIVATYTDAGSVKGTIDIIADGYDSKTITVDEVIAVLAKTDEMLIEEAVTATEAAIKAIETADGITAAVVEKAIANDDITVTVKSEETKAPTTTATGVQTVTITLTLNKESATVTKTFDIDMLEEEDTPSASGNVIWSGSTDLGTDWGTSITVKFDTSKLAAGDTVKVTYKAGTAAEYQQIKLMNGDWTVLESPTGKNEWDCVDLSASATTYEFKISDADVKLLNGTMIVSGFNAIISSVEFVPAAASNYTDPVNTTIPENKIVTQKTAVADGVYNQRFIEKVKASELVDATKIIFTVSNGTKTATYESTKCYSSLNVNGGSISAGDDYVFLGLTIKDIPEDITVTIKGIEIVY